jgi:Ser-tRNA(Ala) deacylase AlaX
LGGRGRRISEFKVSLVYKVSSRTARTIQRKPVSKTKQNKTHTKKTIKVLKIKVETIKKKSQREKLWR